MKNTQILKNTKSWDEYEKRHYRMLNHTYYHAIKKLKYVKPKKARKDILKRLRKLKEKPDYDTTT